MDRGILEENLTLKLTSGWVKSSTMLYFALEENKAGRFMENSIKN